MQMANCAGLVCFCCVYLYKKTIYG